MSTSQRLSCSFFRIGACKKGEACPFSHQPPSRSICTFFQKGNCSFGEKCKNIHDNSQVSRSKKDTPCSFYASGNCNKGGDCEFVHEAPNPAVLPAQVTRSKKDAPCSFYASGNCNKGDDCDFVHEAPNPAVLSALSTPSLTQEMSLLPANASQAENRVLLLEAPPQRPASTAEGSPCSDTSQGHRGERSPTAVDSTRRIPPSDSFTRDPDTQSDNQPPSDQYRPCATYPQPTFVVVAPPYVDPNVQRAYGQALVPHINYPYVPYNPYTSMPYPHALPASAMTIPSPSNNTDLCQYLSRQGGCPLGSQCAFRHHLTPDEYRAATGQPRSASSHADDQIQQLDSIPLGHACKFFAKGVCNKGSQCPFRHDALPNSPLSPTASDSHVQPSAKMPIRCHFYAKNSCRNGDSCPYLHETDEVKKDENVRLKPCRYFAEGKCHRGNKCTFAHDGADKFMAAGPSRNSIPEGTSASGELKKDTYGWDTSTVDDGWGVSGTSADSWNGPQGSSSSAAPTQNDNWNTTQDALASTSAAADGGGGCDGWGAPPSNDNTRRDKFNKRPQNDVQRDRTNSNSPRRRAGMIRIEEGEGQRKVKSRSTSGANTPSGRRSLPGFTDDESQYPQSGSSSEPSSVGGVTTPELSTNWSTITTVSLGDTTYSTSRPAFEIDPIPESSQEQEPSIEDFTRWGISVAQAVDIISSRKKDVCSPAISAPRSPASAMSTVQNASEPPSHAIPDIPVLSTSSEHTSEDACVAGSSSTDIEEVVMQSPDLQNEAEDGTYQPENNTHCTGTVQVSTSWADDEDDNTWAPQSWGTDDTQEAVPVTRKYDSQCLRFAQGYCPYGDTCMYLHISDDDLQGPKSSDEPPLPRSDCADDSSAHTLDDELAMSYGVALVQMRTPFESTIINLSNLPLQTSDESIYQLVAPFGEVVGEILMDFGNQTASARVEFRECEQAVDTVRQLNGIDFRSAQLVPLYPHLLPTPSRLAWAYFDTVSSAKAAAEELDGKLFEGKKISAAFTRIRKGQTHSFPIKIDGLPPNADKSSLSMFLAQFQFKPPTTLSVASPTYTRTADTKEQIRRLVEAYGVIEELVEVPYDLTESRVTTLIQFSSEAAAVEAVNTLHNAEVDFLGKNKISVRHTYHQKYILTPEMGQPIRGELEQSREVLQEHDCTVRWEERPDAFIVFMFCLDAAKFARAMKTLEPVVRGKVMLDKEDKGPLWDDYFDHPSSTKFLDKLNGTDKFLLRDFRTRRVLVFGDLEKARQSVFSILDKVHDLQFSVDVEERGRIAGLLNGGLEELENIGFGANKLSFDFVTRTLVVRGKIDDSCS
ncbi:hypothetical protein D9758_017837 [Tetrapyrgos nigripes]|uniref:Uncharacterized protein n=1 Tax=Tetrapyrgos nigripes TaxID=182062 RepID=A0A8H5B0D8_9AGAR|nr:hypothetical protein D9758_017837 [Tetrapyrgos nigripes]